ncbi:WhiB family transcriptional regulator (plasmid) [Rhodococcoides fascians]|uniref:WhiB family transcriptional regulator n=1 Tax=Rhodococcoides fascians TaxID=1828 RepID=UPI00389AC862
MPIAMFYPPHGLRGPSLRAHESHAKAVCEQCPVLDSCRRHAVTVHEPYGIWGGLAARERIRLAQPD